MGMYVMIGPITLMDELYVHSARKIERDIDEFMDATKGEDELQIVLRAHLYIEYEIEKMLRNYFVEPKVFLGKNPSFISKLNLVVALGLLPKDKMNPYEKFNTLRNRYAHRLRFSITDEKLDELASSLDKELKRDFFDREWNKKKQDRDENCKLLKLKWTLLALWVYVSKLVYDQSIEKFEKRRDEIEEMYNKSVDDEVKRAYVVECTEMFNKLKNDLEITEESLLNL
ncbi:hypothetical protein CN331_11380 [Bacillus cereus]|nr:hypothetical protein CN331_11380 [Bacillus cereus]